MNALILISALFFGGNEAYAHTARHVSKARPVHVQVNFHWIWVEGHMYHDRWVKGCWSRRSGNHPRAHQRDMHWVSGHYQGRGPSHRWVPGHWKRK